MIAGTRKYLIAFILASLGYVMTNEITRYGEHVLCIDSLNDMFDCLATLT